MVTLTADERAKFAAWLRQEVASDEAIVGQMEKIAVPASLVRERRIAIATKRYVANLLESIEDQEIRR